MDPHIAFGGGATETILGPYVLAAMIVLILLIFALPRKYVIAPLLFGLILTPAGQSVFMGGAHFYVTRILILAGWLKLFASKASGSKVWDEHPSLDKVFLFWAIIRAFSFMMRHPESGAFVNQLGFFIDDVGGFFLIRALIRDREDIDRVIRVFCGVAVILAGAMLYEEIKDVNLFGIIGNAPVIDELRNGYVRAQGPFEHALLAGTFAATLLPLFFWLWKSGRSKKVGIAGMVAVTVIPFTTQCSTPILAYGAALFALCFWPFHKQMRLVRWGIVAAIVGLQLVMKSNVWWIIQHMDVVGGSSGWHRAELINDFVTHFFDWWLIGTSANASWGHMTWDLCNQYVAEGEVGGLATFIAFISMICICFKWAGNSRKAAAGNRKEEWFFWILGAALFSHVIAYFGISYFDQTRYSWFALLAIITAATYPVRRVEPARQEEPSVAAPIVQRPWAPAPEVVQPGPALAQSRSKWLPSRRSDPGVQFPKSDPHPAR
jgi:hypothetical protein